MVRSGEVPGGIRRYTPTFPSSTAGRNSFPRPRVRSSAPTSEIARSSTFEVTILKSEWEFSVFAISSSAFVRLVSFSCVT